jgi:hypothetical protein
MGIILFLLGAIFGSVVMALRIYADVSGNLRIDQSDPDDKPYMFLELHRSYDKLISKKFVLLKVRKEDFISQD